MPQQAVAQMGQVRKKCLIAFLSDGKDGADAILADRIGEFACAKFSSRCHSKLWHKGVAMKLSLRRSMTISLVALLLVLLIVFGAGNVLAIRFVTRNIYQNTEVIVALQQEKMDEQMNRIDSYFYTLMTQNSTFTALNYLNESEREWYSAVSSMSLELSNAVYNYEAGMLFDYLPATDTYIVGASESIDYALSKAAVRSAAEKMQEQGAWHRGKVTWQLTQIDDTWYLMRVLKNGREYTGAFLNVDELLQITPESAKEQRFFTLLGSEGESLWDGPSPLQLTMEEEGQSYVIDTLDDVRYLVVYKPLTSCDYLLANFIPYTEIKAVTASLRIGIFAIAGMIFLIWLILYTMIRRNVLEPITTINSAMQEVGAGNLEQRIAVHSQSPEFASIARNFNLMVTEIKDLKIDAYEQQLAREKLETQYLKQQITPHFMINCLNTACQLTEFDETALARELLKELSVHLRYVLSSGQTVQLAEELELVTNYIRLSNIRYPDSLQLEISCPERLRDARVVPLIFLNFVENTIKHAVVLGEKMQICIEVVEEDHGEEKGLRGKIWDSGPGYSAEILENFRTLATISVEETPTSNIGVANVMQRTRLVFGHADFDYSNGEQGGARMTFWIPLVKKAGKDLHA